jgi:hypothetical protein
MIQFRPAYELEDGDDASCCPSSIHLETEVIIDPCFTLSALKELHDLENRSPVGYSMVSSHMLNRAAADSIRAVAHLPD